MLANNFFAFIMFDFKVISLALLFIFKLIVCSILVIPQAAQSYPVLLITLYLYINSILKIIRKSCVINLLRYIFI
jgi:hypothetical protein